MRTLDEIIKDLDKFPAGSPAHRKILKELDKYWKAQKK